MKRRFIFDLDGTLLHGDFSKEREYFRSVLSTEEQELFLPKYFDVLMEYENIFDRYDVEKLSDFLSKKTRTNITPNMINEWITINCNINDILLPETIDMLEYLKSRKKSLVILTNWFRKGQETRLYNADIRKYFDEIYAGDFYIKPTKESYLNACGDYDKNECIVIGDNLQKDVYGPNKYGIDSIYYNPNNKECDKTMVLSIDSFERIKEMF
ncbi:MAG: HAD family hydrolase [Bacilli bacterium]|nr:HAD family hydrolase [Bacilli bacterium]